MTKKCFQCGGEHEGTFSCPPPEAPVVYCACGQIEGSANHNCFITHTRQKAEIERLRGYLKSLGWEPTEHDSLRRLTDEPGAAPLAHSPDIRQESSRKGYVPESQFAGILKAAESGDPVNTIDLINALWSRVNNQKREIARLHAKTNENK